MAEPGEQCIYGKVSSEGDKSLCGGADPEGCILLSQLNHQAYQQLADVKAGKLDRGETLDLLIGHGEKTLKTATGLCCRLPQMQEAVAGFKGIMNEAKGK